MKSLIKQSIEDLGVLPFILMVVAAMFSGASFFVLLVLVNVIAGA